MKKNYLFFLLLCITSGFYGQSQEVDSVSELDEIIKILNNNRNIHVELSTYTDSRGNNDYNLKLSERRAQASLQYLVSKGISKDRITAKGYGEHKMLNKCVDGVHCSEAAHEKNRRTEFAFINPKTIEENFDNNISNTINNKITEEKVVMVKPSDKLKIQRTSNSKNLYSNNKEIKGFRVYPNPVNKNKLYIKTFHNGVKKVQLSNILGKEILNVTLKGEELDISKFDAGVYILKVYEEGSTSIRKLVVK